MNQLIWLLIFIIAICLVLFISSDRWSSDRWSSVKWSSVKWVGPNKYTYPQADSVCANKGMNIASLSDVTAATYRDWTTDIGWVKGGKAIRVDKGKLQGGNIPPELRLGVFCR